MEEKKLLNNILNAIDYPLWCIDKNYNLLYYNSSFKIGAEENNHIKIQKGINMVDFLKENNKKEYYYWKTMYDNAFLNGKSETIYYEIGKRLSKIDLMPIFNVEKTKVLNLVGIIEDITNISKTENELKEKNKSLEQFAYITAHDLKTPLRSLSGLVITLLKYIDNYDKDSKDKIVNISNLIKDNALKMNNIIEDTLSYSRASKDLMLTKYQLRESVINALHNLSYIVSESNVEVKNLINGLYIKGDKGQINQLLQNLISNSIKFNDKKDKIVTIGELPNVKGFYVEDNGNGIDKKYIDKIFKMFQRLDTTKEGTGIGLTIVEKVINNHNWKIEIDSVVGEGSKFKIYIK